MSLKKLVLIVAVAALVTPAVAFADGISFVFFDGHMTATQPANSPLGSVATNSTDVARLVYVSRFAGNTVPGGSTGSALNNGNLPPQIAPTFGSAAGVLSNTNNFGSVQWTTGTASSTIVGATSSSTTYNAGGLITILSNGSLVPVGTMFSGSFTGPTTLASAGAPANPICTTCMFWYTLSGPVSGTIDPSLLTLLGLSNGPTGTGLFFSFVLAYVGPNDTVGVVEGGNISLLPDVPPPSLGAVPEPGTLALFGTGLIALAGFVRRRIRA